MSEKRFVFEVEWYNTQSHVVKRLHLVYHCFDSAIEILQLKEGKKTVFLRRTVSTYRLEDLFIGNVLNIFSKQFRIIDYAELFTRQEMQRMSERTFAMIKPNAYLNIGNIISAVQNIGLRIANLKMFRFSEAQAKFFYQQHVSKEFFPNLLAFITSDFLVGMELIGPDAIRKWRELIGPTNTATAKQKAPKSLRALYGVDGTQNAVHGSDSPLSAKRQIEYIFSSAVKSQPILSECSLCLIKPHILTQKKLGRVVDQLLQAGFQISAMQMFWADRQINIQFFDCYRGVLPQINQIVQHNSNGPCVALQVRQENCVNLLRAFAGPSDPAIAKALRPQSLRAKFGEDRVRNCVHVTDLAQDGRLQVNYWFKQLLKI